MSCRIGRVAAGMRWGDTAGRSRRRRPMARPAPRRRDDDDEGERERKLLAWIWEWIDSILIHGKGMGLINKQGQRRMEGRKKKGREYPPQPQGQMPWAHIWAMAHNPVHPARPSPVTSSLLQSASLGLLITRKKREIINK